MARQFSDTVRNALANAYESTIGTAPTFEIRSGSPPANCAAADTGTLLATGTLPSDWLGNASGGSKALAGTWTITGGAGAGSGTTAGHFRIKASTTCHDQGTITVTGGGGDLTLVNTNIVNGQATTITSWSITISGA
jgi:hypothetical protein